MTFDYELKLSRARKHLDDLDGQLTRWLDAYSCTVRQEFDPQANAMPDPAAAPEEQSFYMLAGSVVMPGFTAPAGESEWGCRLISIYLDQVSDKKVADNFGLLIAVG